MGQASRKSWVWRERSRASPQDLLALLTANAPTHSLLAICSLLRSDSGSQPWGGGPEARLGPLELGEVAGPSVSQPEMLLAGANLPGRLLMGRDRAGGGEGTPRPAELTSL